MQIQEIPTGHIEKMALSDSHFVYLDEDKKDVIIYHKDDTKNQTFTFLQQLDISGPDDKSFALDGDILVVGGMEQTHIFSEHNGDWGETITLEQSFDHYEVSGRNIIAVRGNKVFSYNIEDCTQEMPTGKPSLSFAPTPFISSYPSLTPSLSNHPTVISPPPSKSLSPSAKPTKSPVPTVTCYWVDVSIVYDYYPRLTGWEIYRLNNDNDDENHDVLIADMQEGVRGDTSHTESVCLEEGEYKYVIWDTVTDYTLGK